MRKKTIDQNRQVQETSVQEVVFDCFRVRYKSEAGDVAFLMEKYRADVFLRVAKKMAGLVRVALGVSHAEL